MDENIRAKYAALNQSKKAAKAAKGKGQVQLPVVAMNIPYETAEGREIDLEQAPWDSLPSALVDTWRTAAWIGADHKMKQFFLTTDVKRKIVRT